MATIKLREIDPVVFDYNVGIGDANPSEKLVISQGSIRLDGGGNGEGIKLSSFSSSKNGKGIYWLNNSSSPEVTLWQLLNDESSDNANDLTLRNTANTVVMRIKQDGKIGFGVDGDPVGRFHIGGALGGEIRLTNSSIGDSASDGASIKAHTDKHLYINNIESTGGIKIQTQGIDGFYMSDKQNVSIGGVAEIEDPDSRLIVMRSNIAGGTANGLLTLYGKFDQSTIDVTDQIAIRTVLYNSSDVGRIDDPIKFSSDETNTYTFLNQGNGKVGIGSGVTGIPDGTLEIAQGGSEVVTKVRLSAVDADAYLSFGDGDSDWYVGVDHDQSSGFVIGNGSGAPSSGNEGLCIATNGRVGINIEPSSPYLTEALVVRGKSKFYELDGTVERGIILSYSYGNDSGIIDTTTDSTHLEFRIGNATKGWLTTAGYFLVGNINSSSDWGASALEVDGPILAKGGTAAEAGFLFRGDTNTGMVNSTANTLDFYTTGKRRLQIGPTGKIKIGETQKAPIRHYRSDAEGESDLFICQAEDHTKDVILYSYNIPEIDADDILMMNINWGLAGNDPRIEYTPNLHYAMILGINETTDLSSASADFTYVSQKRTTHPHLGSAELSYSSDLTGGQTVSASCTYDYSSVAGPAGLIDNNSSFLCL